MAAEDRGPLMLAHIGMMLALRCGKRIPEARPSKTHWEKRKLKGIIDRSGRQLVEAYNMIRVLLSTLALLALCGDALAWGDLGHKIICEIAFRLVQPDTRPPSVG
jgi:hypothetical protein